MCAPAIACPDCHPPKQKLALGAQALARAVFRIGWERASRGCGWGDWGECVDGAP